MREKAVEVRGQQTCFDTRQFPDERKEKLTHSDPTRLLQSYIAKFKSEQSSYRTPSASECSVHESMILPH